MVGYNLAVVFQAVLLLYVFADYTQTHVQLRV